MKKRINKFVTEMLCRIVRTCRSFPPEEHILIFAEPRGGSTWLAEIMSKLLRIPILWEPLHLRGVEHFKKAGLGWEQVIPEDAQWEEAKNAFEELLRGKVLNEWLCIASPPLRFLFAKRMLIKFCRGNALLPWLTRMFRFKYAPIYLVRHPLAVVCSQLKHGAWDALPEKFVLPNNKYNDIYVENIDFLTGLKNKAEVLLANWCIMNASTITNPRNDKDWITVHYEDLVLDPEFEMRRIFGRLGLPVPDSFVDLMSVPSRTAKDQPLLDNKRSQLEKWMYYFDQEQLDRFSMIMRHFKVECYNVVSPVKAVNECSTGSGAPSL